MYMLKAVLSMLAITLFPVWLSLGATRDSSSETVSPRRALFCVVMYTGTSRTALALRSFRVVDTLIVNSQFPIPYSIPSAKYQKIKHTPSETHECVL